MQNIKLTPEEEKEFDLLWGEAPPKSLKWERREQIKAFIATLKHNTIEEEKEKIELNIGMLRQWLNEDRITDVKKMVTNGDLKYWIFFTHN